MTVKLELKTTIWLEMKPDIYAGENCDQINQQFQCQTGGDTGAEILDTITFNAKDFPPGTTILVKEPCCPKCTQEVEMCKQDENCNFDWHNWCEEEYS